MRLASSLGIATKEYNANNETRLEFQYKNKTYRAYFERNHDPRLTIATERENIMTEVRLADAFPSRFIAPNGSRMGEIPNAEVQKGSLTARVSVSRGVTDVSFMGHIEGNIRADSLPGFHYSDGYIPGAIRRFFGAPETQQ